jgi:hypothetical protein
VGLQPGVIKILQAKRLEGDALAQADRHQRASALDLFGMWIDSQNATGLLGQANGKAPVAAADFQEAQPRQVASDLAQGA